jgi:hypothetical protein
LGGSASALGEPASASTDSSRATTVENLRGRPLLRSPSPVMHMAALPIRVRTIRAAERAGCR